MTVRMPRNPRRHPIFGRRHAFRTSALAWVLGLMRLTAASGELDATFGTGGVTQIDVVPGTTPGAGGGLGNCVAVQADRKILVAGPVSNGYVSAFGVARYLPNGNLDRTFGGDGKVATSFAPAAGSAAGIAVQSDNKIVVAGTAGGDFALVRYLPDGTLDTAFSGDGKASLSLASGGESVTGMALQADGKIVVAGYVTNDGIERMAVARFLTNGEPDPAFGSGGSTVFDFGGRSLATCVALQADGKIVLGGATGVGYDMALARCNADGTLDPTFGSGGKVTTSFGSYTDYAMAIALQPDGKILLGGYTAATAFTPQSQSFAVARYLPDGSLDPSFGSAGSGKVTVKTGLSAESVRALAVLPNGDIAAVGYTVQNYGSPTGNRGIGTAAFDANGQVLGTFGLFSYGLTQEGAAMALQGDGGYVVAGSHYNGNKDEFLLCRFGSSGFDTSFGSYGYAYTQMSGGEDMASCAALAADGKIYVAGSTWAGLGGSRATGHDFAIARVTASGALDTTFSGDGIQTTSIAANDSTDMATAMALQADGKPVVIGSAHDGTTIYRAIVRYLANGNLDTTFGTGGKFTMAGLSPAAVAVQANGRILVAGPAWVAQNNLATRRMLITRHLANGTLDSSFGSGGSQTVIVAPATGDHDQPYALGIQADGKILVAGTAGSQACVVRLLANGSLDTAFDGDGKVMISLGSTYSAIRALALQADGKIVVAGYSYATAGKADFALARYLPDGSLDPSFGAAGIVTTALCPDDDQAYALAIQDDGRLVVAGYATVDGMSHCAVARYWNDGRPDTSYHGAGFVIQPLGFARSAATGILVQPNGATIAAGFALREYDYDFVVARFEGGPEIAVETASGTAVPSGTASSFGTVNVGDSRNLTLRARNLGSSTLNLTFAEVERPAAGFRVVTPPAAAIAPGGVTEIVLGFAPVVPGAASATVRLHSDDADEGIYELALSGTGNGTPSWSGYAIATPWQTPCAVAVRKLLAKATDADGDTLSVAAAGPASANGGKAVLQGPAILYTPPGNFSGADTFAVTIADSRGASVTGTVTVDVGPPATGGGSGSMTFNPPRLAPQADGSLGVSFHGIPGRIYQVQRSTDLTVWSAVATVTASASGTIAWTDPAPPRPNAYYRLALP